MQERGPGRGLPVGRGQVGGRGSAPGPLAALLSASVSAESVRQMQKCKQDLLEEQPPRGRGCLIHPLESLGIFHSHEKLLP